MEGSLFTPPDLNLVLSVECGEVFDIRHFNATERMSALFDIRIVAVSDNPDVDFERIIGRPMAFTVRGRQTRTWTGVCNHLRQIGVEERGLSTYELSLVPTLWLLTQRRNHRMFQLSSEVDIVQKLLAEWSISPVLKLTDTYKKRKIRVQYAETDYAFFCRMLEDAGVSFYFENDAEEGKESRLVLDDGPQGNAPRVPIAYREHPTVADLEHVTTLRVGRRLQPGRYTVRDHDYRRPADYPLVASAATQESLEAHLERYHYVPGAFLFEADRGEATPSADARGMYRTDENAGNALVQRRLDAKRAPARMVSFETNVIDPGPGSVVSFLDHPKSELEPGKTFLVVESNVSGTHSGEWSHGCTAVSTMTQFRPELRTPKPKVMGVESATVVGPAGDEIHVDEFGRVCVHFHWDRESRMDDQSSCWIHVSQPWGGSGYGGSSLPRIGQEVIVDFLGGDPDRPVIIGRVYTNLQKTPYKLPDNKTQSGWKSNSTGGGGGYNELMFEDAQGQELLRMQAEKDLDKLVKNDERVKIGQDRSKEVGRDDSHDVGRDRTRSVGRDESVEVGQDRTRSVGRDESVEVGQDRSRSVGRDEQVNVGNDRSRSVGRDEMINIGRDFIQSIAQNREMTIGEDYTKNVGGSDRITAGQNQSIAVGQNRTSDVGMVDSISVGERFFVGVKPPPLGIEEMANAEANAFLADGSMGFAAGENKLEDILFPGNKIDPKSLSIFKVIGMAVKALKPSKAGVVDKVVSVLDRLTTAARQDQDANKNGSTGSDGSGSTGTTPTNQSTNDPTNSDGADAEPNQDKPHSAFTSELLKVLGELGKEGSLGKRGKIAAKILEVIDKLKEKPKFPAIMNASGASGAPIDGGVFSGATPGIIAENTGGANTSNDEGGASDSQGSDSGESGSGTGCSLNDIVKATLFEMKDQGCYGGITLPDAQDDSDDEDEDDDTEEQKSSTLEMVHQKIVLDTGAGAVIIMEGPKVTISASVIDLLAGEILHSVPLKEAKTPNAESCQTKDGNASGKSTSRPQLTRKAPTLNRGVNRDAKLPSRAGKGANSADPNSRSESHTSSGNTPTGGTTYGTQSSPIQLDPIVVVGNRINPTIPGKCRGRTDVELSGPYVRVYLDSCNTHDLITVLELGGDGGGIWATLKRSLPGAVITSLMKLDAHILKEVDYQGGNNGIILTFIPAPPLLALVGVQPQ